MADETANGAASAQPTGPQLALQRVYLKDASFEAPHAPRIFQEEGQPNLQLNLSQKVSTLAENVYEVVLSLTLTCTLAEKNAYLVEVQQAGIFTITGFDQPNLEAVLSTYCPNTLFPYARQVVSDMVQNGGFPPYLLQPINFEQLFAEQLRRRAEQAKAGAPTLEAGNA
jgi:preprotein translocase subunit SecB